MKYELNMIDYIDFLGREEIISLNDLQERYHKVTAYAIFLKSPPKLGDFVPTNEDGDVMEKIERYKHILSGSELASDSDTTFELCQQYESALDRVLWKKWEYVDEIQKGTHRILFRAEWMDFNSSEIQLCSTKRIHTYDDLITSGIKLERIERK